MTNRHSVIKPYEAAYGENMVQNPCTQEDNVEMHGENLREPVQVESDSNSNAVLENGRVVPTSNTGNIENETSLLREDTGKGMHMHV